jgi:hypothetical protein
VGGDDNEGIVVCHRTTHADGGYENLDVSHNQVYDTSATGIAVYSGGGITGLTVLGNTVNDCGDGGSIVASENGIEVYVDDAPARNINVMGNTVENVWEDGIKVWAADSSGSFQSVSVCNNTVRDWSKDSVTDTWWGVKVLCGAAARAMTVCNNTMYGTESYGSGLMLDFAGNVVDGMTVHGNTGIVTTATSNTTSMYTRWGAGSEVISFVGNTFQDFDTGVTFTAGVAANFGTVSANVERIDGGGGNWATFFGLAFVGGTSSATGANIDS